MNDDYEMLNVLADEAYELLRLKLEEKQALEEVALLDDLMALQGAKSSLKRGKMPAGTWREVARACVRVLRLKGVDVRTVLTGRVSAGV